MSRTKDTPKYPELGSWKTLNQHLKEMEDPKLVYALIAKERKGRNRLEFIQRIYGRYATLRAAQERKELGIS